MSIDSSSALAVATGPAPSSSVPVARKARILGLDVARSLAILGIFIAHYGQAQLGESGGWAESVKKFTDGRALPVFVLLAGAGFTFLTRRGEHPVREILGRSLLLLLAGLIFEGTTTIFLILHFYALYFVVALAFRKASNQALLWSAGAFVAGGWVVHTFGLAHLPITLGYLDYGLGNSWGAISMLAHPKDLFTALVLNGTYPLLPTFAFFLVGMWLGRQDLADRQLRKRLATAGLAMAVIATGIGWAAQAHRRELGIVNGPLAAIALSGSSTSNAASDSFEEPVDAVADEPAADANAEPTMEQLENLMRSNQKMTISRAAWSATDQSGHSNMPAWMIAVTGFALVLVVACLYLAERFVAVATVLAHCGQLALTAYLGHIMLKRWVLTGWPYSYSLPASIGLIVVGFVAFAFFATLWRRVFAQGPLEMFLRMAGSVAATGKLRVGFANRSTSQSR